MTTSDKRKSRRWPWVMMAVLVAFLVWNYWPVESTITISPETTYITEPLNPDGTVNYFQAIVDRASEGVTPDNNAAVLLVRALGPEIFDDKDRAESLKQLSLTEEELEKDKPYFEKFEDFHRRHSSSGTPNVPAPEVIHRNVSHWLEQRKQRLAEGPGVPSPREVLGELTRRPWKADDYPLVAAWLTANDAPLALVAEASQRERLYWPLIARSDPPFMMEVLMPNLLRTRLAAGALAARAMLRLDSGDVEKAKEDMFAVHRVGRQLTTGQTSVAAVLGISVDKMASRAERALIASGDLTTDDIRSILHARKALPEIPPPTDVLQVERYMKLDLIMALRRHGLTPLAALGGASDDRLPSERASLNWDSMLRMTNKWFDHHNDAIMEEGYAEHLRKRRKYDEKLDRACDGSGYDSPLMPVRIGIARLGGRVQRGFVTRCVTDLLMLVVCPNLLGGRELWENANTENDILTLALAAKLYKLEKGQWPADLVALVPAYVEAIPADRFTGEALRYVRGEDVSVTIYSLGPNMTDEGGVNVMELPFGERDGIPEDADDIAITVR